MVTIRDWASSIENAPLVGISTTKQVEGVCKVGRGGRFLFAAVEMTFAPHEALLLEASVPGEDGGTAKAEGWIDSALMGVLDVMLVGPPVPINKFRCTLDAIKHHPVDSSPEAFRLAGRKAAEAYLSCEVLNRPPST